MSFICIENPQVYVVLCTKVLGSTRSFFSPQYRADDPDVKYFLLFPVSTQQATCYCALNMHDLLESLQTKYVGNNLKQFMLYSFVAFPIHSIVLHSLLPNLAH